MTLEERIEANANLTLWCVHVAGPDDLYAEMTHAAAVARADELNRVVIHRGASDTEDVLCFAYADVWPYSREDHAKAMKKDEAEQEVQRKAAIAAQSK